MGKHGAGMGDGWRSGFAGRIEVRESATGRREWPEAVKGRIVRESLEHGASVKDVAHRHGIAPQQLTTWRRAARQGRLALPEEPVAEDGFGFGRWWWRRSRRQRPGWRAPRRRRPWRSWRARWWSVSTGRRRRRGSRRSRRRSERGGDHAWAADADRDRDEAGGLPARSRRAGGDGASRELGLDPRSGLTVIFRSKSGDRLKILVWDDEPCRAIGRSDNGEWAGDDLQAARRGAVRLARGEGWRHAPVAGAVRGAPNRRWRPRPRTSCKRRLRLIKTGGPPWRASGAPSWDDLAAGGDRFGGCIEVVRRTQGTGAGRRR